MKDRTPATGGGLPAGTLLGPYAIIAPLGRGGMGVVYRARDDRFGLNVAIMDVVGHKTLWVSPLGGGAPGKVFEFDDPAVRIDYPVWSPDGRWVLFDRFLPKGGDIWMMDGLNDK